MKVEGESVKDGANSSSFSRESKNLERWNIITPKRKKKEISNDAIITEPVVERKTKKRRKKTIIKVKYNASWCVAQGTQRI